MTNKHPERDPNHLRHALRCARRVTELIADGKVALFTDENKRDALCWNMYQIADATGKVSDAVKRHHPEVPWRRIAAFRNFYAHLYEGIDRDRMWEDIRRGDVADLTAKLGAILREIAPAPPAAHDPMEEDMARIPVALQLYTVREEAARDFVGTLEQVAGIGYAGVELAGYGPLTPEELRAKLDTLGMVVAGSHIALARLENELPAVIAECRVLGCPTVVCPVLPHERRTEVGFRDLAVALNRIGATVQAEGLALCYHNHAFEFETMIDGLTAYDWLAAHTDPALVQLELDAFWVQKAGHDPAVLLAHYAGRVSLVHLKDMTADAEQTFAPVGTGSVDFAPIFAAAERGGIRWYIVEQDKAEGSAIDAARTSFANLKRMRKM